MCVMRYNVTGAVYSVEWACANPLCEQFDCYSGYLSGVSFMNEIDPLRLLVKRNVAYVGGW